MKRWKKQDYEYCPRCKHPVEDMKHVLECRDPKALDKWEVSVGGLREWMNTRNTDPEIRDTICDSLMAWKHGQELPPAKPTAQEAFTAQSEIGWRQLLEGCISTHWQKIQERHYKAIGSKLSGKRWAIKMIQQLWNVAWDQWDQRNDEVQNGEMAQQRSSELNDKIQRQWEQGIHGLDIRTRALFRRRPLAALQALEYRVRLAWLRSVELGRETTEAATPAQRRERELRLMRQNIYNFVRRGTQQPPQQL